MSPHDFSPGDLQRVPAPPRDGLREPEARSVHAYTTAEVRAIHDLPIPDLVLRAQLVHREYHPASDVQLCSLLSVKTGGCPEDCSYCSQSSKHQAMDAERMMNRDEVLESASRAKAAGATRFCMGAAWREVKDGPAFDEVLDMVRGVRALGMEACATLGMLTEAQAARLAEAGLSAYNHNLDTSRSYYKSIISTRTYDDRLKTLETVRKAGITVCCGGIIGMGETEEDRLRMLEVLSEFDPQPESVPINCLMAMPGTPLSEQAPVDIFQLVRLIAVARLAIPGARVRLAAGRTRISREGQALCFFAGANSIFFGDKLLTARNPAVDADLGLLAELGLNIA